MAHCTDEVCTTVNVSSPDSADNVGAFTSITVGADGLPIISCYDSTDGDLKVARASHTNWSPNGWER